MTRYLFIIILLGFSANALAADTVQFTNKELGAIFTLMRPELNSIELNGRKAFFNPSPSIRYLGVEASEIPLDLTVIANIVDLEFNHIKAKTPEVKFANGMLELKVPVEDQDRGIQSYLGSISFKNVSLRAQVGWKTNTDGTQELVLIKTIFDGNLKGTGVLRSNFILSKTRDLCMFLLSKAMKKFFVTEKFQSSIASGLVEYGKFYSGHEVKELEAGSIHFYDEGIKYNVN
jgi:hypothetical protein